jgi:hypothetical protein
MILERFGFRLVAAVVMVILLQSLAGGEEFTAPEGECAENGDLTLEGVGLKILFLHHSTGKAIWNEGVREWFDKYNTNYKTEIHIEARYFPKGSPYPWNNYPYDYWNIWIDHAGDELYLEEPTLEILTREFDVIIWKHCFPVCEIGPDTGHPDVASQYKSLENYKLQYEALKLKMKEFHDTKFIVWTGAAQVEKRSLKSRIKNLLKGKSHDKVSAERAREFFEWVKNEWDEEGDNIFLWDFYELETEGGLYLKEAYARKPTDSHPNVGFSRRVAPLLCRRIVDVIAGRGDTPNITGE